MNVTEVMRDRVSKALFEAGYPGWPVRIERRPGWPRPVVVFRRGLPQEVRWRVMETCRHRSACCFACHRERHQALRAKRPAPPDKCESFGRMFLTDCGVPRDQICAAGAHDATTTDEAKN